MGQWRTIWQQLRFKRAATWCSECKYQEDENHRGCDSHLRNSRQEIQDQRPHFRIKKIYGSGTSEAISTNNDILSARPIMEVTSL